MNITSPPIQRLPDDMLVHIFLFFPATPPDRAYRVRVRSSTPAVISEDTWLNITHTCRRWRSLSLGCPLIWTDIRFDRIWTPVFLDRAQRAPLSIFARWDLYGSYDIDDMVENALKHISHTRLLSLTHAPAHFLGPAMASLKQQTAEMLEVLQISTEPNVEYSMISQYEGDIEVADEPFAQPASRLRRLVLEGDLKFTWRSTLFSSNITHLWIINIARASLPTMDELLDCLRRCPLQELVLRNCFPASSSSMTLPPLTEGDRLVHIPTLRSLTTEGHTVEIADLIRRMRIPASCRVFLVDRYFWRERPTPVMLESLATQIDAIFASPHTLRVPRLRYGKVDRHQCHWSLSDEAPTPLNGEPEGVHAPFTLSLDILPVSTTANIERAMTIFASAFLSVTRLFPIQSLTRLSMCTTSALVANEDAWVVILRELHRVEALDVEGACCYAFAAAFSILAEDHQALPRLKHIAITHAHLSYPLGQDGLALKLESALERRMMNGMSALSLELEYCHVSPAQLEKLERASGTAVEVSGDPDAWGIGEGEDDISHVESSVSL